jgi:hypothetical protein
LSGENITYLHETVTENISNTYTPPLSKRQRRRDVAGSNSAHGSGRTNKKAESIRRMIIPKFC